MTAVRSLHGCVRLCPLQRADQPLPLEVLTVLGQEYVNHYSDVRCYMVRTCSVAQWQLPVLCASTMGEPAGGSVADMWRLRS